MIKIMQVQLESEDSPKQLFDFCNQIPENDEIDILCLLPVGHKFMPEAQKLCDYFVNPMIAIVYFDFEEDGIVKYHNSYTYGKICFDKNVFVRKNALPDSGVYNTFSDLWKHILRDKIAIHVAEIITKK